MSERVERIVIMPRWGGEAGDDWYPWLTAQLAGTGRVARVDLAPLEPDRGAPTIEACVESVRATIAAAETDLAKTLFVGHSVGCQGIMRYLATLSDTTRVAGFVAVAGWFSIDEPWPPIVPWCETPIDTDRVRAIAPRIELLLAEDEPYTRATATTASAWRHRLGAAISLRPDGNHFNGKYEPAVLAVVEQFLASNM